MAAGCRRRTARIRCRRHFRDHYDREGRFAGQVHLLMARVLTAWTHRPEIETLLVSAHPRADLRQQLGQLQLSRSFDAVACTHQRACTRCRRALMAHVATKRGNTRVGTLWLSDDPNDIAAASHQSISSVAALWGRSSAEELSPAKPDLWAQTRTNYPRCFGPASLAATQ